MRNLRVQFLAIALVASFALTATAQPASFLDLGNIGMSGTYTFTTDGSLVTNPGGTFDMDTELGLWDMDGTLLASDDDGSTGLFSQIIADLGPGMYFLGISEFNSIFEDGFINSGSGFEPDDVGDTVLNINGVFAGGQQAGGANTGLDQTAFYKVTVVPEPSSAAALLLSGALIFVRRRR